MTHPVIFELKRDGSVDFERTAKRRIEGVFERIHDLVAADTWVKELHDEVMHFELGRTSPLNDDDTDFFNMSSFFYSQLYSYCAGRMWSIEGTLGNIIAASLKAEEAPA